VQIPTEEIVCSFCYAPPVHRIHTWLLCKDCLWVLVRENPQGNRLDGLVIRALAANIDFVHECGLEDCVKSIRGDIEKFLQFVKDQESRLKDLHAKKAG
jgi:hypothetical protein